MNIYNINGTWELDKRLEALGTLKVDVYALNKQKETPLLHCVKNGLTEFIQPLIDQGSDMHHVAGYGWTPLISALENNAFDIADILIKNKVNIHQITRDNFNAFSFIVSKIEIDTFDIAQQLINLNIDTHLLSNYKKTVLMSCIDENIPLSTIEFICKSAKNSKELNQFIDEIKDMQPSNKQSFAIDTLKALLLFDTLNQNLITKNSNLKTIKI